MEKILLFQVKEAEAVKAIAAPLHIKVETVEQTHYKETLESLYRGVAAPSEQFSGEVPQGGLLLFCHLPDKTLDKMLAGLKKKKLAIDYKAVLTPTNAKWNVLRLYFEMEQEKKAYEGR
jgi:hypothetical protein